MSGKSDSIEVKNAARLPYGKPTLTRYGSVRNLTGGSCGFDADTLFGVSPAGNDMGFGC
ncbi:lasso RiPP family leader peptide-containing protein [Erythrobacter sp. THAF29]|uniref:lasso RiPP family leader peptide-containing protein n=1 Tax=Erythrobacter sp. THAF29 TaxID=2587851 RepID=UPI0012697FC5